MFHSIIECPVQIYPSSGITNPLSYSAVIFSIVPSALASFLSNTIVYVIGVHLAQNSLSPVNPVGIAVILVQLNSELSNHPLNTYPSLVGSAKASIPVRIE